MNSATLRALGGSVTLTLPKKVLETVGLGVGDKVSIGIEAGRIVVAPAKRPRYRLSDLLAQCKGKRFEIDREWESAPAGGREFK
jgi:antitoxin component of MazEF toxin-antitoxin module